MTNSVIWKKKEREREGEFTINQYLESKGKDTLGIFWQPRS